MMRFILIALIILLCGGCVGAAYDKIEMEGAFLTGYEWGRGDTIRNKYDKTEAASFFNHVLRDF